MVQFAGGWLFDRMKAGWDVTILVAEHPDERPLQILGARIIDLECALTSEEQRPRPQALAAPATLLGCDSRVRLRVLEALDDRVTEVALWGETSQAELGNNTLALVEHRLSAVARAFKAQALTAAGVGSASSGLTETFRRGVRARPSVAADLMPAGQGVSPVSGRAERPGPVRIISV